LALLATAVVATSFGRSAAWTTVLEDDFTSIDPAVWNVGSNGGGSVTLDADGADIASGGGTGGGTWLESVMSFVTNGSAVALEARCRVQTSPFQPHDKALFGFRHGSDYVGFYLREAGVTGPDRTLYREVRVGNDFAGSLDPDANYVGEFHTYRIEIVGQAVSFFVDGASAGETSCLALGSTPFSVSFDHRTRRSSGRCEVDRQVGLRSPDRPLRHEAGP
jgi:hypothetical protein